MEGADVGTTPDTQVCIGPRDSVQSEVGDDTRRRPLSSVRTTFWAHACVAGKQRRVKAILCVTASTTGLFDQMVDPVL